MTSTSSDFYVLTGAELVKPKVFLSSDGFFVFGDDPSIAKGKR